MTARRAITAETRVVGVIGDPVRHSRSPAMHNAAFEELGLDWVYVAFPVPRGEGTAAVRAAPALGLAGLNVTMPHKADAASACDELAPDAAALSAVNTVVFGADGSLTGHSTDGEGFLRALADEGIEPTGRRCVVFGAGGAARAIVHALGGIGADVTVAARRGETARAAAALAPGGAVLDVHDVPVDAFDIIVNATPLGMHGEPPPFDTAGLRAGQFVFDTVYPAETPLVTQARARGLRAAGGLGMLVHQGALALTLWTGCTRLVDVMRAAAARTT